VDSEKCPFFYPQAYLDKDQRWDPRQLAGESGRILAEGFNIEKKAAIGYNML
jgi:hypothetical protein